MPKQESRVVQIAGVPGPDDVAGLYVLASDGSVWRYSFFKDLAYWQPLDPLPSEGAPGPLEPLPNDREVATPTRHKLLCDALRQLELGANLAELTTAEIVAHCRSAVDDASSDEILAALRSVGRPV